MIEAGQWCHDRRQQADLRRCIPRDNAQRNEDSMSTLLCTFGSKHACPASTVPPSHAVGAGQCHAQLKGSRQIGSVEHRQVAGTSADPRVPQASSRGRSLMIFSTASRNRRPAATFLHSVARLETAAPAHGLLAEVAIRVVQPTLREGLRPVAPSGSPARSQDSRAPAMRARAVEDHRPLMVASNTTTAKRRAVSRGVVGYEG